MTHAPRSTIWLDQAVFPVSRPGTEVRTGEQMTWYGFRTIASTLLNEQGWHPDLIELQLAHRERNAVRDAYIAHNDCLNAEK